MPMCRTAKLKIYTAYQYTHSHEQTKLKHLYIYLISPLELLFSDNVCVCVSQCMICIICLFIVNVFVLIRLSCVFRIFLAGVWLSNDSHELTKRFNDITLVIITSYNSYLLKTLHWHIKKTQSHTVTTITLSLSFSLIQYLFFVYSFYFYYSHVLSNIYCCVT